MELVDGVVDLGCVMTMCHLNRLIALRLLWKT